MGPFHRAEVERQLLADLAYYGIAPSGLSIDCSGACQEGHCTQVLDGTLEELSDITVVDASGNWVARGWMDFVHGGGANPLFVFWLFLSVRKDGQFQQLKSAPTIPSHLWDRLPLATKNLCLKVDGYDARWAKDPKVRQWADERDQSRDSSDHDH